MKLLGKIGALAVVCAVFSSGCGSKGGESGSTESGAKVELSVAAFKGGYGIDVYQQFAKEFEAKHPGTTVTVEGDPRIWEKLRPKFVAGSPPDLVFPGWDMDHWHLAEEDQIVDLSEAMKSPAAEGTGTWGDTFEPSMLKLGQLEGKQYALPYYYNVLGWWFDPGVFKKNGWTVPTTFDELLALCPKIKAAGLAPITYQGKYPYYMMQGMLLPWAYSIGGASAITDAENLVPGAWKSPAMLKAAQMIKELQTKGFFQEGATGMNHTESQSQFVTGKAAMLPCGTWLSNEMKANMPSTAKMEFMLVPAVAGGKGDPTNVQISIEPWMVPSKGKHQKEAIDLFKYMTSLSKAKEFLEKTGGLMAIKGSDKCNMPEVSKKPAEKFAATKSVWALQFRYWYKAFDKTIQDSLTSLLNGELTPEAFCDRIEAAAEKTRNDKELQKHKV